jgi:hypothetical protein
VWLPEQMRHHHAYSVCECYFEGGSLVEGMIAFQYMMKQKLYHTHFLENQREISTAAEQVF